MDLRLPRAIDLLPLLRYQQDIDGELPLANFRGIMSISLGEKSEKSVLRNKEHDIQISQNPENRLNSNLEFLGGEDPTYTITQREIWNIAVDLLGATEPPDISISNRYSVHRVPSKLESHENLQGIEKIVLPWRKMGNRPVELARRLGVMILANPYKLIKSELLERDQWNRATSHCLKGVLRTEGIMGYTDKHTLGWSELYKIPYEPDKKFVYPPLSIQLPECLMDGKWWTDIGLPRQIIGQADGTTIDAVIYLLKKRHEIVAI